MRSPRLLAAAVLAVAACTLPAQAPHAGASPQRAADRLPILIGSNVAGVPSDPAGQALAYQRLVAAGVRFVRFDMRWADVEKQKGVYDFSRVDAQVSAAHAAGLQVLGIVDYGNPMYSTAGGLVAQTPLAGGIPPFNVGEADYWPPDDPAPFARYAGALAAHLRGQVMAYEIWNEENGGWRFWPPHEDPAAYAALLQAAHDAVKASDPAAAVVFGGVFFPAVPPGLPGMAGDQFLAACYQADARLDRGFDAVAYHPYPYPFTSPEYDAPIRGSVNGAHDAMQAVMAAHGDGARPLWITELGWPTHQGYGVSPEKQAEYLVRSAAVAAAQGIPVFTWYTYGDFSDPTHVDQEAAFGMFDAAGNPKPSYVALQTLTTTLAGTRRAKLATGVTGAGNAVDFTGPGVRVTIVWNSPEGAATDQGPEPAAEASSVASVPILRGAMVTAVGMTGAAVPVQLDGTVARVTATDAPVYVVQRTDG